MIDIFMLIMVIALALIILIVNIYLLSYFCASDDNEFGAGTVCKIAAILGMFLGLGQVCLLPLDVSNTRGAGGEFRMDLIWKIVYIAIAAFVFVIIPLLMSIYECDPESTCCQKVAGSFCSFFVFLFVFAVIFVITFLFLNSAYIPIVAQQNKYSKEACYDSTEEVTDEEIGKISAGVEETISVKVSFPIYLTGLLSFISYILFVVFGGVGIFALPMDMIYSFCTRPVKLSQNKLEEIKKEIVVTAADLKDLAMQIKELEKNGAHRKAFFTKEKKNYNEKLKKLKIGVSVIDDQYQLIKLQNAISQTSALGYLCQLIGGVLCLLISLLWIAHIVVYILIKIHGKPLANLVNIPLVVLTEHNMSFVAIIIFVVLSFYLLICTIKGNIKFGLRLMCLGQIHPMKKDETYMNSILFNVMLIMLSSVAVVQFCIKAFGEYASMTEADIIFNTQIRYLFFFVFFDKYNIFEYALLVIALISFIYLVCRPNDTNTVKRILYEKLENEKNAKEENKEKYIEMTVRNPSEN